MSRQLRVLVLSWNYPTWAAPQRGLWVQRMCDAAATRADVTVLVPTPWVPPMVPSSPLARFRQIPDHDRRGQVDMHFPRVPGSIGYLTHAFDARLSFPAVLARARQLHKERPFDLIHAHFIYPDGVVAGRVGAALGIPVMTSEHAFWTPWLADRPSVRAQVESVLPHIQLIAPVSEFLRKNVANFLHGRVPTEVLPIVVDDEVFFPAPRTRNQREILYVGLIRGVKRIDVLLRALSIVRQTLPDVHLRILSAKAFWAYARDRREMLQLIATLGLQSAVDIVDGADPPEVAEAMRRCALVAVCSTRRETFCSVAAEALACGTPLVVTRCGGPEEFVGPDDGVTVEADDPAAFARGILTALDQKESFDAAAISSRIVSRFGREAWCERAMTLYGRIARA